MKKLYSFVEKIKINGAIFLFLLLIGAYSTTGNSQCAPDVTPPIITCPSNVTVNTDPGSCDAVVNFAAPTGTDNCSLPGSTTFVYTGALQTFTVPVGVTTITIEAWGAQGQGGAGGLGGYAKGDINVTAGQVFNVYVGGQNGYNGGGAGYAAVLRNGGGASDVRFGGTTINDRIIVAGGGGGGGQTDVAIYAGGAGGGGTVGPNYAGGAGGAGYGAAGGNGGVTGGSGNSSCHSGGAGGGGFTTGGSPSCNTCYTGSCGQAGTLGIGGNSDTWENGICYSTYGGTSGGGGGYYGGGGSSVGNCGSGGGGGGSSWTGTLANIVLTGGLKSGNGEVIISWIGTSPTITQLAGLPDGSIFPIGTTTQTFEAEDISLNTSTCSFDIIVIDGEAPVEDAVSLSDFSDCPEANPTPPTATDNCTGAIVGTPDVAMPITNPGLTVVTWTYDDGNGNTSTQTQNVTVTTIDVSTNVTGAITINANNSLATTYQWIDCTNGNAIIPGATNQSYTATADGDYAVVIDEGGCVDTSACVSILFFGTENLDQLTGVKIYPSPTTGNYTIDLSQTYENVQVTITDVSGKIVEQYSAGTTSKITSTFVGSKGMYLIQIKADDKVMVTSLIIE